MSKVYICASTRGTLMYGRSWEEVGNEPVMYVAVKVLRGGFTTPEAAATLSRETILWSLLSGHPNITALYATLQTAAGPCLIMEYFPSSLRDLVRQGRLPLARSLRIIFDVCQGLEYGARQVPGFYHGDLKPENILIGFDDSAHITDLGLSGSVDQGVPTAVSFDWNSREYAHNVATNWLRGGTVGYMAPEAVLGNPGPAGDVYSIGATLFEMLAGVPLAQLDSGAAEDNTQSYLTRTQSFDLLPRETPREVSTLLSACLEEAAAARPTFKELLVRLKEVGRSFDIGFKAFDAIEISLFHWHSSGRSLHSAGFMRESLPFFQKTLRLSTDASLRLGTLTVMTSALVMLDEWRDLGEAINIAEREFPDAHRLRQAEFEGARARSTLSITGDTRKAMRHCLAGISLYPNVDCYQVAAIIADHTGEFRAAANYMEGAANLQPTIEKFYRLVWWYIREKMAAEAKDAANRAVSTFPRSGLARGLRFVAFNEFGGPSTEFEEIHRDVQVFLAEPPSLPMPRDEIMHRYRQFLDFLRRA